MIFPLIFLFFSLPLLAEETILIRLSREAALHPIHISPIQDEKGGFSEKYVKQLESVLKFDFSHNGMTEEISALKPQINTSIDFDFQGDLSLLTKENIDYAIKLKIREKKLDIRVLEVNSNRIRALDTILLTGDLAKDRRLIHQASDSIHKALFGKEGIASTKFLYSVKAQDLSSKKWTSAIYEADYDGGNPRRLTESAGFAITPVYVPPKSGYRSQSFLFVSYKTGQPKIYFGNLLDEKIQRFSLLKGNQLLPAMARQRDKIAFISDITGNPDLFLQAFDSEKGLIGKPRQIYATHRATQGSPAFSPDGKQIAFVSNKDGSPRIYVIDIPEENSNLNQVKAKLITKINRENTAPCFSPDGSKLAYCAMTKGVRQIWLYDFATGKEIALTDGSKNKENPTFAPNSLHLIFNTSDPGDCELYLMNLNQKETVKISSGNGEKHFPAWEPM